eukprot:CAMPEP_0202339972 /NCGR_PEP_ID=MMETSP1126-20121109/1605_1 /ASSEMBLY_ACC=CAM_ASM_000457 /TAXON_ID=3047 /ORGANISM="Dunaliella tertiolecta, Strain CCMP1320" /LENGTH=324 /DNA_ID=CAMNT_0048930599 /DNA_START=843 /DNA_END=1819 /DNA_ORIENTATION=+
MARQGSIPLDKYQRVRAPREDAGAKAENEVRIMGGGRVRTYIQYALELLNEKGFSNVEFAAMGRAINMAVLCAEILKRRVHGLHQITELASLALVDVWEPKEEGLETIRVTRNASAIRIKLSMAPLDTTHPGYQAPLPADQVQPIQEDELDEMDATERTADLVGAAAGAGVDVGEEGVAEVAAEVAAVKGLTRAAVCLSTWETARCRPAVAPAVAVVLRAVVVADVGALAVDAGRVGAVEGGAAVAVMLPAVARVPLPLSEDYEDCGRLIQFDAWRDHSQLLVCLVLSYLVSEEGGGDDRCAVEGGRAAAAVRGASCVVGQQFA